MLQGEFFAQFFSERGPFIEKVNGEHDVLCPFEHDKGFEKRPSAHVNTNTGVFHCKTCHAEGRFNDGGLSEIGFIAQLYHMTYDNAVKFYAKLDTDLASQLQADNWSKAMEMLYETKDMMDYLKDERGLDDETIREYHLAFTGDGIGYPVTIYNQLCDIRCYHPHETPKITSNKGATALLFPFDHWRQDDRPTLLVAGENDCLLARQNGFNALTVTAGEGNFPKVFLKMFTGKEVYVCYDCDEAGKVSSRRVAFLLHEYGAHVKLLDLQLTGTPDDKDLTDYFLKNKGSSHSLLQLMHNCPEYTEEDITTAKNTEYPLVDLWSVADGKYSGKRISSRVVLSGKYDTVMETPTAVEYKCCGPVKDEKICVKCPFKNRSAWWTLDENLNDIMEMVDVTKKKQDEKIAWMNPLPRDCPNWKKRIHSRQPVHKVVFTPDVETEDIISGFRAVEQYAYVVGLHLEDGNRYRAFFRRYPHPLDGQRVFMIVDRVEESDNAINSFQMNPDIYDELKIFQGDPFAIMADRAKRMHGLPDMTFEPNPMIAHAVNIMYHSPLRFKFDMKEMKGYPEGLIAGESRTGKSETAIMFQRYIRVGNHTDLKGATVAGLLGGADKLPNGGHKVTWGIVPRNNRGLVVMDELSGVSREVISALTAMRSGRKATINKIVKGTAPAETRLLWISNPRVGPNGQSRHIKDFPNGVDIVLDLIGSDEDVARFDFCIIIIRENETSPLDKPEKPAYPAETYRHLIHWVWSRTSDQVKFEEGVEAYVVQISKELNEKYDTDVKFFGAEAWKKLSRIAVACAACCFSTDSGGTVINVGKSHVDWAAHFLRLCYDNTVFRLSEYVKERRSFNETNESVNTIVAGVCRTNPMVVKGLLNQSLPMPMSNLQAIAGLEPQEYRALINKLSMNNLIQVSAQGVTATRRFRVAVDIYRAGYHKTKMIPLSQEGVNPV